jgi:hypothetical protein
MKEVPGNGSPPILGSRPQTLLSTHGCL